MGLRLGRAIHNIVILLKPGQQPGNFFGRVLQVIIQGHDYPATCGANATQQCIVLAEIATERDTANTLILTSDFLYDAP